MTRRGRSTIASLTTAVILSSCSTFIGIEDLTHYQPSDGGAGATGIGTPDASAGGSGNGGSGSSSGGAAGSAVSTGGGGQSGSTVNDAGAEAAMLDPMTACTDLATQTCTTYDKCLYITKIVYGTKAVCIERETLSCMQQLSAPGTGLTPMLVRQCMTERKGETCAANVPPASCLPLGTLADGAQCWTATQCAGGACLVPLGSSCGKCAIRSLINGPCYSPLDCEGGFDTWCKGPTAMAPGVCTPARPLGAMCNATLQAYCRTDLWCNGGMCTNAAKPQAMQMCSPTDRPCDSFQGLICDPMTQICRSLTVSAVGQSCPDYVCQANGNCKDNGMGTLVCAAVSKEGDACDDSQGQRCLQPAFCKNKVCVLPNQRCGN